MNVTMQELNDMGLIARLEKLSYAVRWDRKTVIVDISIPDTINNIPITKIDPFCECKTLKKLRMTNSIKHITKYAFSMCENLEEIEISKNI